MALRFMDGFDSYALADIMKKWTSVTQSVMSIQAGQGRRGTACLRCGAAANYLALTLDAQPSWYIGAAHRCTAYGSSDVTIMEVRDSGTVQIFVTLMTDGRLQVKRSSTVLGTTTATIPLNTYTYIEWGMLIHQTAGTIDLRINGVSVLAIGTLDTAATANSTANSLTIGNISGNVPTHDLDDVYICDGSGSAPHNTFLGDCRVDTLLPNADGTAQQWTPSTPGTHYTLVDEAAPNTTDYVASATVGQRDTYGMQDLTAQTGIIYGVQLNLAALKSDAGARSVKPLIVSGASEVLGTATALGTGQTYTRHVQTTDPATAAAWTEAGVNGVQCGAEVA